MVGYGKRRRRRKEEGKGEDGGVKKKNTVYLYPKKTKISKYGMVEDMGLREQSKYLEQMRHFK